MGVRIRRVTHLDVLWPDITGAHIDDALADFARRDRRFGNIQQRASA